MTAVYGIAKDFYEDEDSFVVISDGGKTQFMFPYWKEEDDVNDLLVALGQRVKYQDTKTPDEIVSGLTYNSPWDISISEDFDTYEEALKRANEYMALVNSGEEEPPYTLYDPILKNQEGETK